MYSLTLSTLKVVRKCPIQRSTVLYQLQHCTSNQNDNSKLNYSSKRLLEKKVSDHFLPISRQASKASTVSFDNIRFQVESIFRDVKMKDMATGPTEVFWYNAVSLVPIAFPSLAFLLTGFHPSLFSLQITYSAILLSFHGGTRFGHELEKKEAMTWESVSWSFVPFSLGLLSVMLPQVLCPITLSAGFLFSAYVDLTLSKMPTWFRAMRLAFVFPAVLSLAIAFLWNLFN
ncbi:uncharacterized protein LOC112126174 [Cimex lectularius]|uniref:Transmembrane protein 69 n=1 Tax=Cimex lectularius TaxID=79782 RepID=A0A8I6SRF6_CIMLE|nr:uncharacterized protein LOC112126174 [Cimex lectularius]